MAHWSSQLVTRRARPNRDRPPGASFLRRGTPSAGRALPRASGIPADQAPPRADAIRLGHAGRVDPEVVRRIKAAWASIAEVPQLDRVQLIVRERSALCPPGRIGVLVLDDTVTVSVPRQELKPVLETSLAGAEPLEAADFAALLDRLPPVSALLGPAYLFYPLAPVAAGSALPTVVNESVQQVNDLIEAVSAEELDESGVSGLTGRVFALRAAEGVPVAICGYRAGRQGSRISAFSRTRRIAAPASVKPSHRPRCARPSQRAVCPRGGLDWCHHGTVPKARLGRAWRAVEFRARAVTSGRHVGGVVLGANSASGLGAPHGHFATPLSSRPNVRA